MEDNKLEFDVGDLLWYVNGQWFGFDFISTPKEPKLERWGEIRDKVFEKEKEEIPYYGSFENGNTVWPFVAIIHRDLNRPDNTPGRVIIHKIIWVPPNLKGKDPKKAVSDIPHNWFQQVWEGGLNDLYAEVYSLNKEDACKRVKEKGMPKIPLQPTVEPHENWVDVGVVSVVFLDKLKEQEGETTRRAQLSQEEVSQQQSSSPRNKEGENVGDGEKTHLLQQDDTIFQEGIHLDIHRIALLMGGLAGGGMALLIPLLGIVSSAILGAVAADRIYNRLLKK